MSRRIQTGTIPTPEPELAIHDGIVLPFKSSHASASVPALDEILRTPFGPAAAPAAAPAVVTPTPDPPDGYLDRLLKYIPAEIVALYLGSINVVPTLYPHKEAALWIIAGLTAICTPIYMYLTTREAGKPTLWSQIIISSIAFPVWVFAIGGPFAYCKWYAGSQWISALILSFATFLFAAYKPAPDPLVVTPAATE